VIGQPAAFSPMSNAISLPPPQTIPADLEADYTMGGQIPVVSFYRNDAISEQPTFTSAMYAAASQALDNGTFHYYGRTLEWLLLAVREHPLSSLDACVFGSVRVNCDLIALRAGAKHVDILEYNPPLSEHPDVDCLDIRTAVGSGRQWDAALSISSFEHDGLGRYGDPLDPCGDLRAMREVASLLKPEALLFLSVPVGADCLAWNAHRIYGPTRLPLLLQSWSVVATYGYDDSLFRLPLGEFQQPVFVLRHNGGPPCADDRLLA